MGEGGNQIQNKTSDQYLASCQTSFQLNKHVDYWDLKNFNTKFQHKKSNTVTLTCRSKTWVGVQNEALDKHLFSAKT